MQSRISLGAHRALGVDEGATAEQIRAAFLGLTKTFHPARFGRMAVEVQRLSNEVFLGIKGAHEALLKAIGAPTRRYASASASAAPSAAATANGTGRFARSASPPPERTTTGKVPPLGPRQATPAFGVTIVPRTTGPIPTATATTTTTTATPPPSVGPASAIVRDDDPDYKKMLVAVAAKQWSEATPLLVKLRARDSVSKRFKALQCYVRARGLEAEGNRAAATADFERALQFEPDLPEAKSALAELHRRP
jgi:hypothetical protein